jgi:glycerol uptake facilitator-like aquaporin
VIITAALPIITRIESLALIATTFGSVVGIMILVLGKHSGAVINPAISIAAFVSRNLKRELFLPYIFFQIVGSLGAGITLKILFSSFNTTDLGSTKLSSGISPLTGILIEAVGTFVLASSALVAGKVYNKDLHRGMLVGGTLFLLIIVIGPITGASLNPARSLGPALASPYLSNLYVYLIGPTVGALVAGILFRVVNDRIERKDIVCLRS